MNYLPQKCWVHVLFNDRREIRVVGGDKYVISIHKSLCKTSVTLLKSDRRDERMEWKAIKMLDS